MTVLVEQTFRGNKIAIAVDMLLVVLIGAGAYSALRAPASRDRLRFSMDASLMRHFSSL